MSIGRFFAMVGALVWHPATAKYLVLKRSPDRDFASGAWECITGRVDQGESFSDAVRREIYEELGVEAQIDFVIGTAHFYRGDAKPENEIIGVQYCCSIRDPESIRVSWEHAEHRWIAAEDAETLLPEGHWLGEVIRRAEEIRARMPAALLAYFRTHGFEV